MEPIPFYIVKDFWDYMALGAMVAGSFGSAVAAGAAVWIGIIRDRPRAKVMVRESVMMIPGGSGPRPRVVHFQLTNTGRRTLVVTAITWRVKGAADSWIQIPDTALGNSLPMTIPASAVGMWAIDVDKKEGSVYEMIARDMLASEPHKRLEKLYVEFHTTTGESFKAKLPDAFKQKLRESCDRLETTTTT